MWRCWVPLDYVVTPTSYWVEVGLWQLVSCAHVIVFSFSFLHSPAHFTETPSRTGMVEPSIFTQAKQSQNGSNIYLLDLSQKNQRLERFGLRLARSRAADLQIVVDPGNLVPRKNLSSKKVLGKFIHFLRTIILKAYIMYWFSNFRKLSLTSKIIFGNNLKKSFEDAVYFCFIFFDLKYVENRALL